MLSYLGLLLISCFSPQTDAPVGSPLIDAVSIRKWQLDIFNRLGGTWADLASLLEQSGRQVSRQQIPPRMALNCEEWIRKIVRSNWLPKNLDSLWVGNKRAPTDTIVAIYKTRGNSPDIYRFVWIDRGGELDLMIATSASPIRRGRDWQDPTKQRQEVLTLARIFLNVPPDWNPSPRFDEPRQAFESEEASRHGRSILYGTAATEYRGHFKMKEPRASWFDDFVYWTDGAIFGFEFQGAEYGVEKLPQSQRPGGTWILPEK